MRLNGTKATSIHQYRGLGNQLWDLGGSRPSLDLNFSYTKNLVDGVTGKSLVDFTRASSGTYVGSDGLIKTAATNEPRFDHNPTTGESLGLLVEEQRTNSVRNNTMVGAVAGTPGTLPTNWVGSLAGGLSREVVGTGITNGINYIDLRIFGTATNTNLAINLAFEGTVIAAASGQSWTESMWISMVAGSTTGINYIQSNITERSAAAADLAYNNGANFVPTIGSFLRRTYAVTLGNASTAYAVPGLWVGHTGVGAVVDITLRIGLPQLEQGAFATSVIPTLGTAAVTRSADVCSISGSNFSSWYRQDEGTVFADINSAPVNTLVQLAFDVSEGIGNERYFGRRGGGSTFAFAVIDGGVTQADVGAPVVIPGSARYLSASAYKSNSINVAVAGQAGTEDTTATVPTVDRLFIGQNFASGQQVNGTIRRLAYWPTRLANATLQEITR